MEHDCRVGPSILGTHKASVGWFAIGRGDVETEVGAGDLCPIRYKGRATYQVPQHTDVRNLLFSRGSDR